MASRRTRIGLIGAGWVSGHHLKAYGRLGGMAEIVAIADPSEAARSSRAAEFGIARHYASARDMLAREELDAVDIAAPREMHVELCRAAAERGLAILCQKPLAPTLAEARDLAATLPSGVRIMVHENWRFRPHYRKLRSLLLDNRIGATRRIEMHALTSGLLPDASGNLPALERQPMLKSLRRMLVMEVLIHHLDTLRYLFGPLTLRGSVIGPPSDDLSGEDRATILLSTAKGASVLLAGDFRSHGHPPALSDHLIVQAEAGAARLNEGRLTVSGPNAEILDFDLARDYDDSYYHAIGHFLEALRSGEPFETSLDEHLATLEIVEAVYEGR